jgi:glycerophosphoryl diester phosphodiesterase
VPVDGTRIPRLADLFDLVKRSGDGMVRFDIETKLSPDKPDETLTPEPFARAVVEAIRSAGMAVRSQIQSFDWRTLQAVQKIAPEIATVYLTVQRRFDNVGAERSEGSRWTAGFQYREHGSVAKMIKAAGGRHWSAYFGDLDARKVKEAQSLGPQGPRLDGERPGRHGAPDRLRRRRAHHRPARPRAQAARSARDPLALGARMRFSASQLRKGMKWWPPFLGAGIRVKSFSDDFCDAVVELKLGRLNRNAVGTHFGGSLYAMTDPFFMIMLLHNLGGDYLVWDKSGSIEYVAPGRGMVKAHFHLTAARIAEIKAQAEGGDKVLPGIPGRDTARGRRLAGRPGAQDALRAPETAQQARAGERHVNWPYPRIVAHRGGGALAPRTRWARFAWGPRWDSRAWNST